MRNIIPRAQVVESAARLYLEDQHAAVHSAAELLLRRWGNTEILDRCDQRLKETGQRPLYKGWCTGPNEHTFAILTGPLACRLGSPAEEEGREDHERAHYRRIDRTLAVSTKEVTFDQFRRFQGDRIQKDRFATSPLCPVNNVTWYEGAAYCNWLTDQDPELTKEDRCYAGNVKSGMRLVPDALERHGYRLPTEAEWEYFCRGNTITSRPFGESEELLPRFAWTWLNSQDRLHPVGLLLPNEFGLFDVLGNAYEWCHDGERGKRLDPYTPYPEGTRDHPAGDPDEGRATLDDTAWRMVRGGAYCYAPASSRSAARYAVYVTLHDPYMGFRVVRTLPKERD